MKLFGKNACWLSFVCLVTAFGSSSCAYFGEVETLPDTPPGADTAPQPAVPVPAQNPFPEAEPDLNARSLHWRASKRVPTPLYEAQGTALNGELYVFGGYYNGQIEATKRAYAFDPQGETWRSIEPLPQAVTHAGQAAYGTKIYLAGGFDGDHPGPPTDKVWLYDTVTDSWSAGPPLPKKRGGGALVALGGKLHYFGGTVRHLFNYRRDSGAHWVLDIAAARSDWTEAAPLPNPRNHIAGAALGGKLYAIGGQYLGDEASSNLRDVDVYDPETNTWTKAADLPKRIGHITAATLSYGQRILITGGVTQNRRKLRDVLAYNPETNTWAKLKGLPEARSSAVAGVIGGKLYVTTGNNQGPLATTFVGSWADD